MKQLPALDRAVSTSHRRLMRADLHALAGGALLGTLPVSDGTVSASAADDARWSATLTLAGTEWAPDGPEHPLAGFVPHEVRIYAGATVDDLPELVRVARLLVRGSTVTRRPGEHTVTVELVGLDAWVARGAAVDYRPEIGRSCQEAIIDLYQSRKPSGWGRLTVRDTTAPVPVPLAFRARQVPPAELLADLAAVANVTAYADADGALVIRPPLSDTPGVPVRQLTAGADLLGSEVTVGREQEFANRVRLEFEPVGDLRTKRRTSGSWDRVSTTDPPAGQYWLGTTSDGELTLRIGYRDKARARKRELRRIEAGDLVQLLYNGGVMVVYEVVTSALNDDKSYWSGAVRLLDADGTQPATEANVEVVLFATPDEPRVGVAVQTTGPLGTATIGRVDYAETRLGNVSQARADERAEAMLGVLLHGWATSQLEVVPDPRLEPDDDLTVTYYSGTTLAHRVVSLELPLGIGPMRLSVRSFTDQLAALLPAPTPSAPVPFESEVTAHA